jgi:hypothetical protein
MLRGESHKSYKRASIKAYLLLQGLSSNILKYTGSHDPHDDVSNNGLNSCYVRTLRRNPLSNRIFNHEQLLEFSTADCNLILD